MSGFFNQGANGGSNNPIVQYTGILNQTSLIGEVIPFMYGQLKVSPNLLWYGDFKSVAQTTSSGGKGGGGGQTTNYEYYSSLIMALGEANGGLAGVPRVWQNKTIYADDSNSSALSKIGFSFFSGTVGQSPWSYLTSNYSSQAIGYSGIGYLAVANYSMGSSDSLPNYNYEVATYSRVNPSAGVYDANPSFIISDFLTNPQYGAGFSTNLIGNLTQFSNYCLANHILFSAVYDTPSTANSSLDTLLKLANAEAFFSDGVLKITPYGDTPATGNGVTFTPNLTPIYDITYDDILSDGKSDPIIAEVGRISDAYNSVRINFADRSLEYNPNAVYADDLNSITLHGLRPASPIDGSKHICDATVAAQVAQIMLQRMLYVRTTYQFKVGYKFALLELMDIVTLTEPTTGLNLTPVRIKKIEEDEYATYSITAEEIPDGIATPALYQRQANSGYLPNYNIPPQSVAHPVFFEAPENMTNSGLQVWAAVTGQSQYWGGCNVYVSFDGSTYSHLQSVQGGARYGSVLSIAGDNLNISLAGNGGQLLNTSSAAAQALNGSLCWGGNSSNSEYFSYTNAQLNGVNSYQLSGLVRGAFNTSKTLGVNQNFVRVDDSIIKSNDLSLSLVGTTIYFKFTSFNIFGNAEEELATVTAYPYTITGNMLKVPPNDVTNFQASIVSNGVKLTWNDVLEPTLYDYEIRLGVDWNTGTSLGYFRGTSTILPPLSVGNYDWFIKARNQYFVESVNASSVTLVPTSPSAVSLTGSISNSNYVLSWSIPSSMFAIDHYLIATGNSVQYLNQISNAKITQYQSKANWIGTQTFWVAAVDVAGNIGAYTSVSINITAPPAVSLSNAIVGSDVVLSWSAPVASLPVDHYLIAVGDTLAFSTPLNTALVTQYRQPVNWLGNKTFWVAAVDTAGNVGSYASVVINATPPNAVTLTPSFKNGDFVLNWNIPSSFLPIKNYILGSGSNALNLTNISTLNTTSYESIVNWVGVNTFWVAAVDTAGNVGAYTSAQININVPLTPQVTAKVLDNNVELYWTDSTSSLPITTYKIYRGATFATASLIGSKTGGFTTVTEAAAGTYTYWVQGIDSAGNVGVAGYITTYVSAPQNYVLHSDIFSIFAGTTVNAIKDGTGITMPIDTSSNYGQHFTSHSWNTPQDQINAGYPIYIQPTLSSGYYEDVIDYGTTLGAINVTVSPTISIDAGNPSYSVMVSTSLTGTSWTDYQGSQVFLSNFRYLKVRVSATSPDSKSVLTMTSLEIKLAVSQKQDSGSATVNAGDANGTLIYFNQSFIGVNSITLTPLGTTNVSAVFNFETGANPTYFYAYLFNAQTGARVSGQVSWTASGY